MPVTTTLKALRDSDGCVSGYNRLVRTLQGQEFSDDDSERATHIRFAHKDPIPLRIILDSNGLDDALWSLRACDQTPEFVRACRLYAVWCARQVQHLMTDRRSIDALDVAERHAHGAASDYELDAARDAAWGAARGAAWAAAWPAARDAAWGAARDAAWAAARAAARDAQKQMFIAVFCGDEFNINALQGESK